MDLVLEEQPSETPLDQHTAEILVAEAAQPERLLPPKDKPLHSLLRRMRWLSESMPDARLPKWTSPSSRLSSTIAAIGLWQS